MDFAEVFRDSEKTDVIPLALVPRYRKTSVKSNRMDPII